MGLERNQTAEDTLRAQASSRGHELGSFAPVKSGALFEAQCLYCGAPGCYSPESGTLSGEVMGIFCPRGTARRN